MILKKFNYRTKSYEDYEVPNKWIIKNYCDNLEQTINCASCGTELLYGDSYTSFEIHNLGGFGYMVCNKCHNDEWQRKVENERKLMKQQYISEGPNNINE